ncbi:MAG: ABC transporter ATP-binding protein [Lachnospiraceae bacterium]|nr:ABC transporter ATP-binding protein [Lachnospiraceae bacterium]
MQPDNRSKTYTTRELIIRFLPYYKNHRWDIIKDLFCAGLTCAAELTLPMIIRFLTNTGMTDIEAITLRVIAELGVLYLLLRLIDAFAAYYMAYQGHVMGTYIETEMRSDAYAHLLLLSNSYYNNTKLGQIMGRITNDLFDVTEFAHHCPEEFFIAGVKALVSFVILVRIHVPLTLCVFAVVPLMTYVCIQVNMKMRRAFAMQRHQTGELNARIEDSLLGQRVVKAFTNEKLEEERFNVENRNFFATKRDTYRYMASFQVTVRLFEGIMYMVVLVGGGIFLYKRQIAPGDLVAYVLYVSTLIATIRRIIEFAEQFQRGMTGIERFLEIMDADIEIFDSEGAKELKDPKGEITFHDVSFEYPDDHNRVFQHLNLRIHPGEKLAIVGPSGGGKTTLCNLVPRFYDVTGGSITLDGEDIRNYTLKSLRGAIGMVQQDVYLFSGTVAENISYGKPGATREEIARAAEKAGAAAFIDTLPNGYDTYIGERGVKLSGGQKQRISIARIFLKNPPIIILDEATSALDNESEYEVAKSLMELSEGRTTLTIAHRLTSIVNSDRILVLTDDGIEEEGTHEELMRRKGLYYRFYTRTSEIK